MSAAETIEVDARGLECPMPLLKAKRALNAMSPGQYLRVLATDQGSVRDFRVFTEQSGHVLLLAGVANDDLPILDIVRCHSQDLTHSDACTSHKLQQQPISRIFGPENDLIHNVFIQNFPLVRLWLSKELSEDGTVTGVL